MVTGLLLAVALTSANTEIVVEPDAPKTTRFAAKELSGILASCLGGPVAVTDAATPGKTAIVLGDSQASREAGIDVAGLRRDAFVIDVGARIVIAGRDDAMADPERAILRGGVWTQLYERGTLFGVYEFLERFAGCRFYFPGELGTIMPRRESLDVPEGRISESPAYDLARRYSTFWDGEYPKVLRIFTNGTAYAERVLQYYRNRGETAYIPCCHGSNHFRYPDRFGKSHPEYFALVDASTGKRSLPDGKTTHSGQLCWASDVVEEIYKDVRSYLSGESASVRGIPMYGRKIEEGKFAWGPNCRGGKYVDIMPQDGYHGCKCDACKAAYGKPPNFANDLIWGKTCWIANRLKAENIPGNIVMMAYHPYGDVPAFDIPDNVQVQVATHGPWGILSEAGMEGQRERIRSWAKKLGHKVWLWNYANKGSTLTLPNVPHGTPRAWAKFYSSLAPHIGGAFVESETDRSIYNFLSYYIFGKVCWNPSCDWQGMLDEYYRLMFGPAAAEMREFDELIEDKWLKEIAGRVVDTSLGPVGCPPGPYDIWTKVYSPEVLGRMRAIIAKAGDKVRKGSLEYRRISLFSHEIYGNLEKESRRYMDRIDPKVEDAWRAAHPTNTNILVFGDFAGVSRQGKSHAFGRNEHGRFAGWYGSRRPGATEIDSAVYRSAPASMRICQPCASTNRIETVSVVQYLDKGDRRLKPNRRYRLSYFLKLENVVPLRRSGGVSARIWDDKNVWFPSDKEGQPFVGTTDWIAQSYEFTAGPETNVHRPSYLSIDLREATGTVWVDDVRLDEL